MDQGRRRILAGIAAGLVTTGVGGVARAQDAGTRETLTSRLRDGRLETATLPAGRAQARAMIDATFTRTMRTLCDFPRYSEWLAPVIRRSEVLARSHGRALVFVELALAGGAETRWAELEIRIDGQTDGSHTLLARRVRGDLRELDARVSLVATPGRVRTLVGVTMKVDPDLPIPVDASLDVARSMIRALRLATQQPAQ